MGFIVVARWVLVSLTLLGCAAQKSSSAEAEEAGDEPKLAEPNAEERKALEVIERLGRAIFAQDAASWTGTDAMMALAGGKPDPRIRGWVTLDTAAGFRVLFLAPTAEGLLTIYDVDLPRGERPKAVLVEPPIQAPPEAEVRFRAVETIEKHGFRACSDRYNTVVLPAALMGEQGLLVYALAATTDPRERVLGGHHRFLVSEDGSTVRKAQPLSKDCMTLEQPKDEVAAMVVTSLVSDLPNESHYFAALLYKTPIYVAAGGKLWLVDPK